MTLRVAVQDDSIKYFYFVDKAFVLVSHRMFIAKIGEVTPKTLRQTAGSQQGALLLPRTFIIYVFDIFKLSTVSIAQYVDDLALYYSFKSQALATGDFTILKAWLQ
jgi:hypothetical protein